MITTLAVACKGPTCPEVTIDDQVGVALEAEWTVERNAPSRLEFGVDSPDEHVLEVAADDTQPALMLDLPPETEVQWRAVTEVDGGEEVCEGTATTGALPDWLPYFNLDTDSDDIDPDVNYFIGSILDINFDNALMFIVNRDAEFVWYREASEGETVLQIEPMPDDSGQLIYGSFDATREDDQGEARRIQPGGPDPGDPLRLEMGHHFFHVHEDGTIVYTAADIRGWEDPDSDEIIKVAGDTVVEVSPDGSTRDLFSTWDWFEVRETAWWDFSIYDGAKDWTHANAIDYNAETDTYLVSFANITTLVEIDRATGDPLRFFRGADDPLDGAWPVDDIDNGFVHQHDANWTRDGTLLMVSNDPWSRVVEYEVDEDEQVLREIWTWGGDRGEMVYILGNARRLPGGNTLYGGSVLTFVREITPEGAIAWEFRGPNDLRFGNVLPMNKLPNGQE